MELLTLFSCQFILLVNPPLNVIVIIIILLLLVAMSSCGLSLFKIQVFGNIIQLVISIVWLFIWDFLWYIKLSNEGLDRKSVV